jgi:hypothetical protein
VSSENEFDEAMYALDQYSPKIVKDQLKVEEAKNGDKVEIMKVSYFKMISKIAF